METDVSVFYRFWCTYIQCGVQNIDDEQHTMVWLWYLRSLQTVGSRLTWVVFCSFSRCSFPCTVVNIHKMTLDFSETIITTTHRVPGDKCLHRLVPVNCKGRVECFYINVPTEYMYSGWQASFRPGKPSNRVDFTVSSQKVGNQQKCKQALFLGVLLWSQITLKSLFTLWGDRDNGRKPQDMQVVQT